MGAFKAPRIAAVIAAVLLAAARAADLKIGVVDPYSGGMALYGDEMTRGYDIAVDQANASGGVLGRKDAVVRGSATSAQEGIAAVEQLVGRDKVDVLAGTYVTAISNAASEAALNNGKLYWETNALARDLTDRGLPNFARTGPDSSAFARRSVEGVLQLALPSSAGRRRTPRCGSSTRIRRSAPPSPRSRSSC